jgi:hypothetical protein
VAGGDTHGGPGLRVASVALALVLGLEAAELGDRHLLAGGHRLGDGFEDRVDGGGRIYLALAGSLGHRIDQITLVHTRCSPPG